MVLINRKGEGTNLKKKKRADTPSPVFRLPSTLNQSIFKNFKRTGTTTSDSYIAAWAKQTPTIMYTTLINIALDKIVSKDAIVKMDFKKV